MAEGRNKIVRKKKYREETEKTGRNISRKHFNREKFKNESVRSPTPPHPFSRYDPRPAYLNFNLSVFTFQTLYFKKGECNKKYLFLYAI